MSIDLADVLNDDDADVVDVEVSQYNACGEAMFTAFRQALARLVDVVVRRRSNA